MAPKRKADTCDGSASKKRKAISMEVKVDIIKRSEKGETPTNIGRLLGLSRSTVSTIINDKTRILEHVKGCPPMKSTVITKHRSGLIVEMERLLVLWLEDQHQLRIPVSLKLIQEKAKILFETLKREKGEGCESVEFAASKGWFMRFKARANLHNLKVQGEAASDFPGAFAEINMDGSYCSEGFNVDETGLFWKRMPTRTYIAKEEKTAPGHKESLTLHLGANAADDVKLKVEDDVTELLVSRGEEFSSEDLIQLEKQMIEEAEKTTTGHKASKERLTLLLGGNAANDLKLKVEDDVTELLVSHGEEISDEDLIQLDRQVTEEEKETPTPEPKRFTSKGVADGFALIEEGLTKLEAEDPNIGRYTRVARGVMDCLRCYMEIWEEKKRVSFQPSLERFYKVEKP